MKSIVCLMMRQGVRRRSRVQSQIAQEALFRSNKKPDKICRVFVAEEEGFEPPWAFTQTVFKTASL